MNEENFIRQSRLIDMTKLRAGACSLVGAGAVGSFTALALAKMGVGHLEMFDEDGVAAHNLSNQFYRTTDTGQFKTQSLRNIIFDFSGEIAKAHIRHYTNQKLLDTVVVATDSMASRKVVWGQFCEQQQCVNYIEARMGAELGIVYLIRKRKQEKETNMWILSEEDIKFYEDNLYSDKDAAKLRCTARSVIYNVLMIASLICRAYKSTISDEAFPREQVFDMQHITKASYLIRE